MAIETGETGEKGSPMKGELRDEKRRRKK